MKTRQQRKSKIGEQQEPIQQTNSELQQSAWSSPSHALCEGVVQRCLSGVSMQVLSCSGTFYALALDYHSSHAMRDVESLELFSREMLVHNNDQGRVGVVRPRAILMYPGHRRSCTSILAVQGPAIKTRNNDLLQIVVTTSR